MALMEVAVDNGGYVTPALVAQLGVPAVELRKMVSRGTLESAAHGVYRVPSLPTDRHDALILARLWATGRGVISHDSALFVHQLCDINPTKVHLTIPTSYRISRAGGERYEIHHADLGERHGSMPSCSPRFGELCRTSSARVPSISSVRPSRLHVSAERFPRASASA
jgi:predicted transcriptional regulator of viral defense system